MRYEYVPHGVCARKIEFEIKDGVITNVAFFGGCNGNLKAIAKLVEGKTAEEISKALEGNTCGFKNTSCADQLAKAVMKAFAEEKQA